MQFCVNNANKIIHQYTVAGLFRGLKFSLELIFVVYKIFVNIYLTLIKFSGFNFSGFEPARKLIPHKINQLYGILVVFVILARRYKYRARENEVNIVQIVDDHYQRYMEQEDEYEDFQDLLRA